MLTKKLYGNHKEARLANAFSSRSSAAAAHRTNNPQNILPLNRMAVVSLKPPVCLPDAHISRIVKYKIGQEPLDFRNEKWEIADSRCLDVVALEATV
jgi:hypothetical protein